MQNNQDILHELDNWHQHYTKIQHHLHDKIQDLRTTIKNQNDTIHTLQQQNQQQIRDNETLEDYKTKFTQTQEHLHKEKERLEKLYHKYWETENETEKLRKEVTKWHDWFDQNRNVFDKVFTAAPPRTITHDKPPKKEKYHEPKHPPKHEPEPEIEPEQEPPYQDEPKHENTREIHLPKLPKFPKPPTRNTEPRRKRARPPAKRRIRLKR